jgi:acyl-CoA thioesterase
MSRDADGQPSAEEVGERLYAGDQATQALGIELLAIEGGFARCAMRVRPDMLNGHGTCHGGLIFTLADSAFACNAANRATVALSAEISFLAPGKPGDRLIAEARERSRGGRTGVYDVEVSTAKGAKIALIRGISYEPRGVIVERDAPG